MPRPAVTSDAVIYLPGIMGSELVNARGDILWGMKPSLAFRQAVFGDVLRSLVPKPNDGIRATRPLQWPVALPLLSSVQPYTALERKLQQIAVRPEAVRAFAYDWRLSIADAAAALAPVARDHYRRWRAQWETLPAADRQGLPDPKLTLVCHSMGGLVATHFAAFGDDERVVRQIVTLGTPYKGSLNAVQALATGEQIRFGLFASSLRDAVRKMPGVYELVARWRCVDDGPLRQISPADLAGIGADGDMAKAAFAVMDHLNTAFTRGDDRVTPRCLVGTTQPTRQTVRFSHGTATFAETIEGMDQRGDGTVFRFSAVPPEIVPSYLPQAHGALAKTHEAVAFAAAVLTERNVREFQAAEGIGLRVPDLVEPRQPFTVQVVDAAPGVMCQLYDTETNRLLTMATTQKRDSEYEATFTVPEPGLYRIEASAGGFSAVEQLVAAIG